MNRSHAQLAQENARLRSDLQAFDPQFFEEIEDLKVPSPPIFSPQFAHQQAVRRIQSCEAVIAAASLPLPPAS